MEERVRRFSSLFRGSPRGHGTYTVQAQGAAAGEKVEGRRWTVHEPAGDAHFERHLAGTYGLGAVPLLQEPPGHTWWGAIDVDDYTIDVAAFARMCAARGLPVVPCRTKSGGIHLYAFFSEPVSTSLVRARLRAWAGAVGYPDAEVFPKQDTLSDEGMGGDSYYGNWINLPYQSGDRSTRYALDEVGAALTVDAFLDAAEAARLTASELEDYELFGGSLTSIPADEPSAGMEVDGPPCLVRMAMGGVISVGRNQALFAAATYFKRADPAHVRERTEEFNQRVMVPPLSGSDVQVIVRSAQKKDYNYRCREQPMAGLCDRVACEERKFGVLFGKAAATGDLGLDLGQLVKIMTQPPIFRWKINGEWVDLSTDELLTQRTFLKRVFEVTNARTRPVKPRAWEALLDETTARAKIEIPPPDATREGQLMFHLNRFCTGRAPARALDEILLGKPYFDKETGRTCFVVADLLAYLVNQRVTGITESWVYAKLRERGLQVRADDLKGKPVLYWTLPPVDAQTEEFDVPKPPDDDVPF